MSAANQEPVSRLMFAYRHMKDFVHRRTLLILWIVASCVVFQLSYKNYKHNPRYFYIHKMLGSGLCLSRGTASVLNFACFMIFMPMCRTFMSGLRSLCSSTSGPPAATSGPLTQWPIKLKQLIFTSTVRRLLLSLIDQQQRFHIICAYTIVLAAGCHSISHIVNAYNFSQNYNPQYPELNLAQYHGQDPLKLILFTMPGITGLMMVAIILILLVTATESVRSRHYDIFWYAHRLIIVFVVLLVIHPMGGLLKEQINTDKHWPSLCHTLSMNTSTASAVRYDIPSNVTPSAGESMLIYSQMPGDMVTLNYANESTDVTDTSGNATSEIVTEPNDVDSVTTGYDEDMGQPVTATLSSLYANASQGRSLNDAFSHDETGETDKICQERPRFASLESGTWKWLAAALTIYGIDLSLRLARRRRSSVVLDAKVYEQSSVLEVQLGASLKSTVNEAKPAGRTFLQPGHPRPGSFVFIKCPQISLIEWHPFSLAATTSQWSKDTYSLQIRSTGDWTSSLKEKLSSIQTAKANPILAEEGENKNEVQLPNKLPVPEVRLYMDGPYRSPAEDILSHRISLCVAGGIGVTPYASVLAFINSNMFQMEKYKLRKLHFVWLARSRSGFENFAHVLADVSKQLNSIGRKDLLEVQFFVTQEALTNQDSNSNEIVANEMDRFLHDRIKQGRPDWKQLLNSVQLSSQHISQKSCSIGVFCCGPRVLRKELKKTCRESNIKNESKFIFKEEAFG